LVAKDRIDYKTVSNLAQATVQFPGPTIWRMTSSPALTEEGMFMAIEIRRDLRARREEN
jgi:hypothetical protein